MKADTLHFVIEPRKINGYHYNLVQIYINGKNLIDILKEYEKFFAKESIAGAYEALTKEELADNLQNSSQTEKAAILGCNCGITECWPFLVQVEERGGSVIVWKDFEQPYRNRERGPLWDYSKLGPFKFEKKAYQKEFDKIKSQIHEI